MRVITNIILPDYFVCGFKKVFEILLHIESFEHVIGDSSKNTILSNLVFLRNIEIVIPDY